MGVMVLSVFYKGKVFCVNEGLTVNDTEVQEVPHTAPNTNTVNSAISCQKRTSPCDGSIFRFTQRLDGPAAWGEVCGAEDGSSSSSSSSSSPVASRAEDDSLEET